MAEHSGRFLYSINTFLAYNINERFYGGVHYVWCTSRYDQKDNPASANPREILFSLNSDIASGDKHSLKIERNRSGLVNAVELKHKEGAIDDAAREEILYIIDHADLIHFRPLIYVIDRDAVAGKLLKVSAARTAAIFSREYIVERLETKQFDIIDVKL